MENEEVKNISTPNKEKKKSFPIKIIVFLLILILLGVIYYVTRGKTIEEITGLNLSNVYVKGSGIKETELLNNKYYTFKFTDLFKDSSPDLDLDIDYEKYEYYDESGNLLFIITDKEDKLEIYVNDTQKEYEFKNTNSHKYSTRVLYPNSNLGQSEEIISKILDIYSFDHISWDYEDLETNNDKTNLNKKLYVKTDLMKLSILEFKQSKTAKTRFTREVQNLIGVSDGENYLENYIYRNIPDSNVTNLIAVKDNTLIILEEAKDENTSNYFENIEQILETYDFWKRESGN